MEDAATMTLPSKPKLAGMGAGFLKLEPSFGEAAATMTLPSKPKLADMGAGFLKLEPSFAEDAATMTLPSKPKLLLEGCKASSFSEPFMAGGKTSSCLAELILGKEISSSGSWESSGVFLLSEKTKEWLEEASSLAMVAVDGFGFLLDGLEEVRHCGVVIAITFAAHRYLEAMLTQKLLIIVGAILAAAIRMMDAALGRLAERHGHL